MEQKTVLVSGASRGIGRAIAESFAVQGYFVIGTATSQTGAEAISDYLGKHGIGKVLNVTDSTQVDDFLAMLQSDYQGVDILINNAGITRDNLLVRMSSNEWDDVITTNLSAIFRLTKGVLRTMMKKRWGRVISIGSVVGTTGNAGQANYAAAKAGVIGFSKSLAREVASRNITVNVVSPGFIATDMTAALSEEQKNAIAKDVPANRLGTPEEIAGAVAFLASDSAAYITGETLHVNGGMSMS